MSYRAKNHELKTYGTPKKVKKDTNTSEQTEVLNDEQQLDMALKMYEATEKEINRAFILIVPIMAFLIGVIAANMTLWSPIATFVMCTIAFLAVGVRKQNLLVWVAVLSIYAIIDNILTYSTFNPSALPRHLGTMLIFLAIIHFTRPFLGQWVVRSKKKQQELQQKK